MDGLPLKYGAIMSRRGIAPIVVIIALAIAVLLGGGAVVAWKTSYLDSYLPQTVKEFFGKSLPDSGVAPTTPDGIETPSQDSEPTAEDPTKDWKIYTNEEFGFSFKHPNDWFIRVRGAGPVELVTVSSRLEELDASGASLGFPEDAVVFRIAHELGNYYGKSLKEYVESSFGNAAEIGFAGKIWITSSNDPANRFYFASNSGNIYSIWFSYKDSEDLKVLELIASTITFR